MNCMNSLVNCAYKIDNIVSAINKETCCYTIVGIRRFVHLQKVPGGHFDVALGRIPNRTDVGEAHSGHLIGASHIVDVLMHPGIEHMLVLIVAQVQHEIGCDQHEVGELVALTGIATAGQLVGKPSQSSTRH